jgi:hypothetical protein
MVVGPDSTWFGDHSNDKYAEYPHRVAWEGVGEELYSACMCEI